MKPGRTVTRAVVPCIRGNDAAKGEQIVRAPVRLVKAARPRVNTSFPLEQIRSAIRSRTEPRAVQYIFRRAGIPI